MAIQLGLFPPSESSQSTPGGTFSQQAASEKQPLPEKLRPQTLESFVGQAHLRKRIEALLNGKRLPSTLLFGPPGCGKSSLALLLASSHTKRFVRLSAPEVSIPELRSLIKTIDILILDELHRFSKAQQDFFLPALENGSVTLIATTTENPSFSVTPQLLSRLHTLRLQTLTEEDLIKLAQQGALHEKTELSTHVLEMLVNKARGDARNLLNLVEYVCNLSPEEQNIETLAQMLPEILARHDKGGDSHYELASALIKSIRGTDPDAALYYLGCLLEGGEDPRFICRRLILSATEDVGLADPQALPMAVACQQAVEFIGMPEGFIPLAETVVYLALAKKSNSTYLAYKNVADHIKNHGKFPVPLHLRNPVTALQKQWNYGKEYQYPHDSETGYIEQTYLPDQIQDISFYTHKTNGQENSLVQWWQEIQATKNNK